MDIADFSCMFSLPVAVYRAVSDLCDNSNGMLLGVEGTPVEIGEMNEGKRGNDFQHFPMSLRQHVMENEHLLRQCGVASDRVFVSTDNMSTTVIRVISAIDNPF